MVSIDEEVKAAWDSEFAINALVPSSPCLANETTIAILRNACLVATKAAAQNFSSKGQINGARHDVGVALPGLIQALENEHLTQPIIDRGRYVVAAWLSGLE